MTKKWKLSKYKAIFMDKHGHAFGMSGIAIEPKRKRRIGHARHMYMSVFDYDAFIKTGYAVDQNGYYVFKYAKHMAATVTRVLGDDGFKKFVATVLSSADWLGALDKKNESPFDILCLFNTAVQLSELEISRKQREHGGIASIFNFKISQSDKGPTAKD